MRVPQWFFGKGDGSMWNHMEPYVEPYVEPYWPKEPFETFDGSL